jgi:hypothetical protein
MPVVSACACVCVCVCVYLMKILTYPLGGGGLALHKTSQQDGKLAIAIDRPMQHVAQVPRLPVYHCPSSPRPTHPSSACGDKGSRKVEGYGRLRERSVAASAAAWASKWPRTSGATGGSWWIAPAVARATKHALPDAIHAVSNICTHPCTWAHRDLSLSLPLSMSHTHTLSLARSFWCRTGSRR